MGLDTMGFLYLSDLKRAISDIRATSGDAVSKDKIVKALEAIETLLVAIVDDSNRPSG